MLETEIKNNTAALAALAAAVADLTAALRASAPAPVTPAPAPVAAPAAPVAMSGDELRKLCVRAGAAGLTAEVVQFLSDHGVAKLAALPPADYPALVALLKAKGVE